MLDVFSIQRSSLLPVEALTSALFWLATKGRRE
jgi:hypothetical protein